MFWVAASLRRSPTPIESATGLRPCPAPPSWPARRRSPVSGATKATAGSGGCRAFTLPSHSAAKEFSGALYRHIRGEARSRPDVIGLRLYVEDANLRCSHVPVLGHETGRVFGVYEDLWIEPLPALRQSSSQCRAQRSVAAKDVTPPRYRSLRRPGRPPRAGCSTSRPSGPPPCWRSRSRAAIRARPRRSELTVRRFRRHCQRRAYWFPAARARNPFVLIRCARTRPGSTRSGPMVDPLSVISSSPSPLVTTITTSDHDMQLPRKAPRPAALA